MFLFLAEIRMTNESLRSILVLKRTAEERLRFAMTMNNMMEVFVEQSLDEVLRMFPECCKCSKCREDIECLALNHLPPKYVSTEEGNLMARLSTLDAKKKVRLIQEIAKAVQIVAASPRHHIPEHELEQREA